MIVLTQPSSGTWSPLCRFRFQLLAFPHPPSSRSSSSAPSPPTAEPHPADKTGPAFREAAPDSPPPPPTFGPPFAATPSAPPPTPPESKTATRPRSRFAHGPALTPHFALRIPHF